MSTKQSLINRLATLMDRHRALDKQVSDDYKNRVDDSIIQKEKFDKLHLKREIEILQKRLDFVTSMKDGLVEQDANMNEIKYFASEFLIQRFLGLTPDDLRLNKKLKEIEDAESLENAKKAAALDL